LIEKVTLKALVLKLDPLNQLYLDNSGGLILQSTPEQTVPTISIQVALGSGRRGVSDDFDCLVDSVWNIELNVVGQVTTLCKQKSFKGLGEEEFAGVLKKYARFKNANQSAIGIT